MPESKSFLTNMAASITWDGIKRLVGCSLVTAMATAFWQKTKNGSLDWWAIGGMFALTLLIVGSLFWKRRTLVSDKESTIKDGTDWRKQYLEENRQRVVLQSQFAESENRALILQRHFEALRNQPAPEMTDAERESIAYQNKLIELGRSIEGILKPLQIDALHLSSDLLDYLKEIGQAPPPKYTSNDIHDIPSEKMEDLILARDVDFEEACEFYNPAAVPTEHANQIVNRWKSKYPWYQKMEAGYALRFKARVEEMKNRFKMEELTDDAFSLPVEYRYGADNIRKIASAFWELTYRVSEKERS